MHKGKHVLLAVGTGYHLLLIVQLLVARLVQFTGVARIFTFLPSCCLAIAQTWVAYYVYLPYNPSINFAAPIALAWTLFVFAGYRKIPSASLRVLAEVAV